MEINRRTAIRLMGAGTLGMCSNGFTIPVSGDRYIVTLSFDDGFEKSSIKTVEIHEKHGVFACINVVASAHQKQFEQPNDYHKWPVGGFDLWNDLKRRGHEIMPHGYEHANLGEMPLKDAKVLVHQCIDMFNSELDGFQAAESVFNLPYNSSTPELEQWLVTQFRIIRTHGGAINPLPHKDMVILGCTSFGPENIDQHLVGSIDTFLEGPPGWFVYNTHGLDDEGWGPLSSGVLDQLLGKLTGLENVDVLPVIHALNNI